MARCPHRRFWFLIILSVFGSLLLWLNCVPLSTTRSIGSSRIDVQASDSLIVINGNSALDVYCAGNGTNGLSLQTAHVIDAKTVDAGWGGCCLNISNTNRYLIISNSTFSRSGSVSSSGNDIPGLLLKNCSNVIVNRSRFVENLVGISMYSSFNCIVIDSAFEMNQKKGIYVTNSGALNITSNFFKGNQWFGMDFFSTNPGITVYNNTILDTHLRSRSSPVIPGIGINAMSSNGLRIIGNTINNCDSLGIYLDNSDNCNVTSNHISNCYKDCILDWQGSGNIISGNTCISAPTWFAVVILIPIVIGILFVVVIFLVLRLNAKKQRDGRPWLNISSRNAILAGAGLVAGLIMLVVLVPVQIVDFYEDGIEYQQFALLWGNINDLNPEHQLLCTMHSGSTIVVACLVFLAGIGVYLVIKGILANRGGTTAAKPLTIPLWGGAIIYGLFFVSEGYIMYQVGRPVLGSIIVFMLHSLSMLVCIAGIIFAWRVRVGPWLMPPSSWEDVGKLREPFRDIVHELKDLHDSTRDGILVLDELAAKSGRSFNAMKHDLQELTRRRFIDGRFVRHGHEFLLKKVNLSFIINGS